MNEWIEAIESFWDALIPWTPALMIVVLLAWWSTLIGSFRERIGADQGTDSVERRKSARP